MKRGSWKNDHHLSKKKETLKIFIANLQPKYKNHLQYLGLDTFNEVYQIGIKIEAGLLKNSNQGGNRWSHKKNYTSSSSKDVASINAMETTNQKSKRPPR